MGEEGREWMSLRRSGLRWRCIVGGLRLGG